MGRKLAGTGAAGWLATVRKVFMPTASSKDLRHARTKQRGGEVESSSAVAGGGSGGGGEAAEVVSVEHFPAAETSPEVTNDDEGVGAMVWLEREGYGEVAGSRREHRRSGTAAAEVASRVAAAVRGRTGAREERAAVRIQAFYRGCLARRARRALRGLVRLQALVRGHLVRRQVHRTMRCMQALVRAQHRARRLPSPCAGRRACRPGVAQRRPSLLVSRHQQHGADELDDDHEMQEQQPPPRRGNVNPSNFLQGTWGAVRADGVLLRHDAAATRAEIAPATYAYEFQHRRQADELQETRDNSNAGWHWMETNQHHGAAAETAYATAAATENAVDTEAARKSPTRDLYPAPRPPVIPGYMAATQSARAKARMAAPPPAAAPSRAHARTRSGSAAPSGGSASTASSSWGVQRAVHSSESSCSGDRTPTQIGGWSGLAFASASHQYM